MTSASRAEPGGVQDATETERYDLCHECGGLCCCLYLAHDENGEYIGDGWLPEYIALWLERLQGSGALIVTDTEYRAGAAGVAPLHDPRLSHLPTPVGAAYRATLSAWIDVRKCQFCHPDTGCLLARDYRADICRDYVCELWLSTAGRACSRTRATPGATSRSG